MSKIYMMVGIQGSGKSTLSKNIQRKFNIPIVSSDSIRTELPNLPEEEVFPLVYKRISEHIKNGISVIYDATSISVGARANLFNKLEENGVKREEYNVECIYFIPNAELSKKRVEERNKDKNERYLPIEVIDKFAQSIVEPTMDEGFDSIVIIQPEENLEEVAKKMD